jgi:hypothetical protein
VDAALDCPADGRRPVLLDPLQLELGDQGQDPNRKASYRGRAIEVVLDRDKPGAGLVQASDRAQGIDRRAGEAVESRNHDPTRLACLAAGKRLLEGGPFQLGPQLIDLFPPRKDLDLVQLCPVGLFLRCSLGRDERLALAPGTAADADVTIGRAATSHTATRRREDR